jgi:hypothetical protein
MPDRGRVEAGSIPKLVTSRFLIVAAEKPCRLSRFRIELVAATVTSEMFQWEPE